MTSDRARIYWEPGLIASYNDFLVIEKTDGNNDDPDGGIAFTNKGSDNIREVAMVIKGSGNVGIGTVSPSDKLEVNGDFSATGTKNFKIDHPLQPTQKLLIHAAIEAPRNDLIYRGIVKLQKGNAFVDIDTASNMSPGTFAALTQNAVVTSLQNQDGFDRVKPGKLKGGTFEILCENPLSEDTISWVVMAERNDPYIKHSDLTDVNGHLIPELEKGNLINADPEKDYSTMLKDVVIDTNNEMNAGENVEMVRGLGKVKGYYLNPEVYGKKYPTRKVTYVYNPELTETSPLPEE